MDAVINIDHQALAEEITERVLVALKPMLSRKADGDMLLTVEDLCKYLQVKKGWIYQQVHSEAIPFLKAGNKLLFRKFEIDEYLAKGRRETL